jgi:uncharacterized protein
VSQAENMTAAEGAALAFEAALLLAGLWLIWRLALRVGARPVREALLREWRLPAIDFACFLCLGLAGAFAMSAAAGLLVRHSALGADAVTVLGSAAMEGGLLLGLAGFFLVFRGRSGGAGGRPDAFAALRSGLATFLVAMPLVIAASNAWEYFLTRTGLPDEKQELVDILENTHSAALRWSFVAVATLLVPVAEELLFRGGLFRYFRTRMPRWAAIAFTSALFGALHVAWGDRMSGLPSLLPLIVLAAVFCLAYERTGKIGTVIVAHALFNLNMMVLVIAGLGQ